MDFARGLFCDIQVDLAGHCDDQRQTLPTKETTRMCARVPTIFTDRDRRNATRNANHDAKARAICVNEFKHRFSGVELLNSFSRNAFGWQNCNHAAWLLTQIDLIAIAPFAFGRSAKPTCTHDVRSLESDVCVCVQVGLSFERVHSYASTFTLIPPPTLQA